MIYLKTYVKKPQVIIKDLDELNKEPEKYFVELNDESSLLKIVDDIDREYIEGGIYLEYDGLTLLDYTYWDIVDQLWVYLINAIEGCIQNNKSEFYFPDQPIKLKMKKVNGGDILLSIESNNIIEVTLPMKDFFESILNSGEKFFLKLQDYFDDSLDYSNELEQIKKLRNKMI